MKPKLCLLLVLAGILALALSGVLGSVKTSQANVNSARPIKPIYKPQAAGGLNTTQMGEWSDVYSETTAVQNYGMRSTEYLNFSGGGMGNPDIAVTNGSPLGDFLSGLDLYCTKSSVLEWDTAANASCQPYTYDEQSTDLIAAEKQYLVARGAIYPLSALFFTSITNICLNGGGTATIPESPLNILTMQLPWQQGLGASTVWLGGGPAAPSDTCTDTAGPAKTTTAGSRTSPVPMTGNPPIVGDSGKACTTAGCADKQVRLWASPGIQQGNGTVQVTERVLNSGPFAGSFKDVWDVEVPAGLTAAWVTGASSIAASHWTGSAWAPDTALTPAGSGTEISFSEDNLAAGVPNQYVGSLSLTCSGSGDYLAVVKAAAYPKSGTTDNNLSNNVSVFTVRVKCGAAKPAVDKQVVTLSALVTGFSNSASADLNPPIRAGVPETGGQCSNATDDDGDTLVNDGCPMVGATRESLLQCKNAAEDDGDPAGAINDGCPTDAAGPVGKHIQLLNGQSATVKVEELKRNYSDQAGLASTEWLVAEAPDLDGNGYDIGVSWDQNSLSAVYGDQPPGSSLTPTSKAYIPGGGMSQAGLSFNLAEPNGPQILVTANLTVTCSTAGTYLVPVKAVDMADPEQYSDSNTANNALLTTLTVYCWADASAQEAADDEKDDDTGIYPRWATNTGAEDYRMSFDPASPAATALRSDTGFVERLLFSECYWHDIDGAPDLDTSGPGLGWVSAAESMLDGDVPVGIDDDHDCLADAAYAQPGTPADLHDDLTGEWAGTCPAIYYNGYNASNEPAAGGAAFYKIQYTKAADGDCDGLMDGIEVAYGTNPMLADTDGDGATDFQEMFMGTNPVNPDTDGDGLLDKPEDDYTAAPLGGAANSVPETALAGNCADGIDNDTDGRIDWGTNPLTRDPNCDPTNSDGDSFADVDERALDSNPYDTAKTTEATIAAGTCSDNNDNDGDGKKDGADYFCLTADDDGDGASNNVELALGSVAYNEAGEATSDDNCPLIYNPGQANNDGRPEANGPFVDRAVRSMFNADTLGDACDTDDDNDLIVDVAELDKGTDPFKRDTDGDGCIDGVEFIQNKNALDPAIKCAPLAEGTQKTLRACHVTLPDPTSGWSDFAPGFSGSAGVELDLDNDGSLCPYKTGTGDKDADNGSSKLKNACAFRASPPSWPCTEIEDNTEGRGYGTALAVPDSDGDACEDGSEIADINGSRQADSLDTGQVQRRVAGLLPADPVSDAVFDANKNGAVESLDVGVIQLNANEYKPGSNCGTATTDALRSLD